jgi:hypothetical protein
MASRSIFSAGKSAAITAALLLGGCAATMQPVSVTRFHRVDPPAASRSGIYDVIAGPSTTGGVASLANRTFETAVARQLDAIGLRSAMTIAHGDPDYFVTVGVDRTVRDQTNANGSGVSVGIGGGTGGFRSGGGVGVGVGLDLSRLFRGAPRDAVLTTLSVRITRRGESLALWEGRAETVVRDGTPEAQTDAVAMRLAEALFRDYPGRSGETITVL